MASTFEITSSSTVTALACDPGGRLLAAGTIEGIVEVYNPSALMKQDPHSISSAMRNDEDDDTSLVSGDSDSVSARPPHETIFSFKNKDSCRGLAFNSDGTRLASVSKDGMFVLFDTNTGKPILRKPQVHKTSPSIIKHLSDTLYTTGDDSGVVRLWDTRAKKLVHEYHENTDFISDVSFVRGKRTLVTTSGDGCLSVFDIRKKKAVAVSATQDDELLSVTMIRNNTKAVVGTQSGTLLLFSFGDWGDCTDRFPGHPMSVSSILPFSSYNGKDNVVLTGSSDGIVRAVSLLPNVLLGTVGPLDYDMPIEQMGLLNLESVDTTSEWLAFCSHDDIIRLWKTDLDAFEGKSEGGKGERGESSDEDDSDQKYVSADEDSDGQEGEEEEDEKEEDTIKSENKFSSSVPSDWTISNHPSSTSKEKSTTDVESRLLIPNEDDYWTPAGSKKQSAKRKRKGAEVEKAARKAFFADLDED